MTLHISIFLLLFAKSLVSKTDKTDMFDSKQNGPPVYW